MNISAKSKALLILLSLIVVITAVVILYYKPYNKESVTFILSTKQIDSSKVPTRYILEIYQEKHTPIYRQEQESETFIVKLDRTLDYECFFWADGGKADDNTNGVYNASSLKNIRKNADKKATNAFYAKHSHLSSSPLERNVSLEIAVEELSEERLYKTDTYEGKAVKIGSLWWAPVNVGYTTSNPSGLYYTQCSTKEEGVNPHADNIKDLFYSHPDYYWKAPFQGPCPEGWRVPTKEEYEDLLAISTGDRRGSGAIIKMRTFAGLWFSSTERIVTNIPRVSVFFPAAGYWDYNELYLWGNGTSGYYWSSTDFIYMEFKKYRDNLVTKIKSTGGYTDYSIKIYDEEIGVFDPALLYAFPVRCVQD